jgi:hypothetical protein
MLRVTHEVLKMIKVGLFATQYQATVGNKISCATKDRTTGVRGVTSLIFSPQRCRVHRD